MDRVHLSFGALRIGRAERTLSESRLYPKGTYSAAGLGYPVVQHARLKP
jgi:hypothetical protein